MFHLLGVRGEKLPADRGGSSEAAMKVTLADFFGDGADHGPQENETLMGEAEWVAS